MHALSPLPVRSRVTRIFVLIAGAGVVLLAIAATLASFGWPLAYNHAVYLAAAQSIADGSVLGSGIMDTKGPMSYLPLVPPLMAGATPSVALRLVDALFVLLMVVPLWRYIRSLATSPAATLVAGSFALLYLAFSFRRTGEPDGWIALTSVALVCAMLRGTRDGEDVATRYVVLAAVLAGAGFYLKPFYLAYLALPVMLSPTLPSAIRAGVRSTLWLIPVLALGALMLWGIGGWNAWLDVQFGFNLESYSSLNRLGPLDRVRNVVTTIATGLPFPFLLWAPWAVLALGAMRLVRSQADRLLLSWLAVGVLFVLLQGRPITYQYFVVVLPLALILVRHLLALHDRLTEQSPLMPVLTGALVVLVSTVPLLDIVTVLRALKNSESTAAYWDHFAYAEYSPGNDARVAAQIRSVAAPGDRVEVWGQNTATMVLTGHLPPSRFVAWVMLDGQQRGRVARYRSEYLASFTANAPTVFVAAELHADDPPLTHVGEHFPALRELVRTQYAMCARTGHLTLFVRKRPGAHCPSA